MIPYRDAFSAFGINSNKFMCSIEALLTRIQKTSEIPSINGVVDGFEGINEKQVLEARDEIVEIVESQLGGEAIKGYVDKDNAVFSF